MKKSKKGKDGDSDFERGEPDTNRSSSKNEEKDLDVLLEEPNLGELFEENIELDQA